MGGDTSVGVKIEVGVRSVTAPILVGGEGGLI